MTAEQIEKAIEKIRPEKCDIDGWIVVEYKDLEIIRNTIGKLVKENEKLKYNARGQVNDYFKDKYADEVLKNAKLQKRIDKAIEYIKRCNFYGMRSDKTLFGKNMNDLLNILQGSDGE